MCSSGRRTHEGWHLRLGLRVDRVVFCTTIHSLNISRHSGPCLQRAIKVQYSLLSRKYNSISKRDVPYDDVWMGQMLCLPTTKKLSVNSTRKRWKKVYSCRVTYSILVKDAPEPLEFFSLFFTLGKVVALPSSCSYTILEHTQRKFPLTSSFSWNFFLYINLFSLFPSFLTQESDSSLCS